MNRAPAGLFTIRKRSGEAIPATAATSYTYTLPSLPSVGNHTYTLVATAAYQGGTINSLPVTVSLQVPGIPASPSSFTVVLH